MLNEFLKYISPDKRFMVFEIIKVNIYSLFYADHIWVPDKTNYLVSVPWAVSVGNFGKE